ncbi:MAG: aspartate aminotransferase family protein, partial [Hyphomicrobiales bacterium]|nr:aspartate aminotransferase family protein [Hyphomicrobiales bacterium]
NGKIKSAAMEQGLMCYPMGGTIDGKRGDHIVIAPPFIIEESHIEEIVEKLSTAFDRSLPTAA